MTPEQLAALSPKAVGVVSKVGRQFTVGGKPVEPVYTVAKASMVASGSLVDAWGWWTLMAGWMVALIGVL
ncbi:hypothetical protein HDU96_010857 [Phlyctochytrium bullatum]|nr:hypothetical protein HDU96_010857 [Phlyctochytrium bullatum]